MAGTVVVVSSSFPFGNGESFLATELEGLVDQGARVVVVPVWPRGERNGWFRNRGVEVRPLHQRLVLNTSTTLDLVRTGWRPSASSGPGGQVVMRDRLRELVATAAAAPLARELSKLNVDGVHAYWATGPATAVMGAASRLGIPWSFTAHSWDIEQNFALATKSKSASGVRFISDFGMRQGVSAGVVAAKSSVIHIGVRPDWHPNPWSRPTDRLRLICPANLAAWKGHRYLLEATRLLLDRGLEVSVTFAGDGPERSNLESKSGDLGLRDIVDFRGHVPHDQLLKWYRDSCFDLVVLPSLDEGFGACEGIPVSLMEAMAAGLPVVATYSGGTPELVPEGLGLLVTPGDPIALAHAIQSAVEDPEHYSSLARACFAAVTRGFDTSTESAKLLDLILNVGR